MTHFVCQQKFRIFRSAQKPMRNKAAFEPCLERAPEEIMFHGQYQAE